MSSCLCCVASDQFSLGNLSTNYFHTFNQISVFSRQSTAYTTDLQSLHSPTIHTRTLAVHSLTGRYFSARITAIFNLLYFYTQHGKVTIPLHVGITQSVTAPPILYVITKELTLCSNRFAPRHDTLVTLTECDASVPKRRF